MPLFEDRLQQVAGGKTLQQWILDTAQKYNLPTDIFTRQLWQESRFDPQARSAVGAQGIAQLMPGTAQELGVEDPSDIPSSVEAAGKYLAQQRDRFGGDINWGLAAYNAGPGRVQNWREQGLTPEQIPFPETRNYVQKLGTLSSMAPAVGVAPSQSPISEDVVSQWMQQNLAPTTQPPVDKPGMFSGDNVARAALRVGLPVAGGILGSVGGPLGMAGGAALGGALGSAGAQYLDNPDEINPTEVGIDAALSAIPSPLGGMASKAGTSLLKRLALTGLEGAAISEADLLAKRGILEGRLPSAQEAFGAGTLGALTGAAVGGPLSYIHGGRPGLEEPPITTQATPDLAPPPITPESGFTPAAWAHGEEGSASTPEIPPGRFFDTATQRLLRPIKAAAARMARADENEALARAYEAVGYGGQGENDPLSSFVRDAYAVPREMPVEDFSAVQGPSGRGVVLTQGKEGLSLPYSSADVFVVPDRAIRSASGTARKLQDASGQFSEPAQVMEFVGRARGGADKTFGLYRHDYDNLWELWKDDFVKNAEGKLELAPDVTPDYLFSKAYMGLLGHEGVSHVGWDTMAAHGPGGRKSFTDPNAEKFYNQTLDQLYAEKGEGAGKDTLDALENEALRLAKKQFPDGVLIRPEGGDSTWAQFPTQRASLTGEAENVMVRAIPAIKEAVEEAGIRNPQIAKMYREALEKGGGGGLPPALTQPPLSMPSGEMTPPPLGETPSLPSPPKRTPWSETALEVLNMPRATATSLDLSMALRQGLVASARHPILALKALGGSVKSAMSRESYNALEAPMRNDPDYKFMVDQAGLSFSDIAHKPEDAYYGSRMIRNLFKKAGHENLDPIFASERAFTYFLNKMRFDVMKSTMKSAEALGVPMRKTVVTKAGEEVQVPTETAKELARWTNIITGHGNFPKGGVVGSVLQGSQNLLNTVFFSPRLVLSRLESLNMAANPIKWAKTFNTFAGDAPSKQAALELLLTHQGLDLAAAAGVVGAMTAGAAAALDASVEMDPKSSDFLQLRKGTTRVDLTGGFRPYFIAGARLLSGQTKPQFSEARTQNRVDTISQFGRSRFSPLMTTAYDMLNGTTYQGDDYWGPWRGVYNGTAEITPELAQELAETAMQRVGDASMPMLIRDLYQANKEDPALAAAVALPAFLGAGLNTHGLKDGISKDLYEAFKEGEISPVGKKSSVKLRGIKSLTGEDIRVPLPWESQQKLKEQIDKPFYQKLSEFTGDERFKALSPLGKHLMLKTIMVQFATMRSNLAEGLIPPPQIAEAVQRGMEIPEGLQEPPLRASQER